MPSKDKLYDAVVVGGGPAGATAALVMARAGLSVRVCERVRHPRFRVGESFMPRVLELLRELGLEPALRALPHVDKRGAEFAMGDGRNWQLYPFTGGLLGDAVEAFSLERAPFDAMLLEAARAAGAEIGEDQPVRQILRLADGDVLVETDSGERIAARTLIDASGQATVVGKHLKIRRVLQGFKKVAYFEYFEGMARRPGIEGGYPTMVMCDEGWFWIIPMDERRDSVGLVLDADAARRVGVPAERMLEWGIERCPLMRQRAARARRLPTNLVCADFSYRCEPYAGPGYFLVGDAAAFVDPIFSTGLCIAMMSATEAARGIVATRRRGLSPRRARRRYNRFMAGSSEPFFRTASAFYEHSFRELFLNGVGPLQVHKAVLSVLAGSVFPRPVWALRWRLWLFFWMVRANRRLPLVPRRPRFSLFGAEAEATAAGRSPASDGIASPADPSTEGLAATLAPAAEIATGAAETVPASR